MTVADLIAELQKYPPGKPVRLSFSTYEAEYEDGPHVIIGPDEALDVDRVVYEGSHVAIEAL